MPRRALLACTILLAAPAYAVDAAAAAMGTARHNDARSQVALGEQPGQPAGANIAGLTWDDALAAVAQAWADRCVFEHNDGRSQDYAAGGGSGYVGENIYASGGQAAHGDALASAVSLWFSEVDAFTYPGGASGGTGHYTQVLWASTRRVGCGVADCDVLALSNQDWSNAQLVVCNYAPGGNSGGAPYVEGAACSQCPGDLPACAQGLCVSSGSPAGAADAGAGDAPPIDDAGTGDGDAGPGGDDAGAGEDADAAGALDDDAGDDDAGDDVAGAGDDDAGRSDAGSGDGGALVCRCATAGAAPPAAAGLLLGAALLACLRRTASHRRRAAFLPRG